MPQGTGTLGSKIYITDEALSDDIDTEEEFLSQSWTEISLVTNLGEFGRSFSHVSYQEVSDGRSFKLKSEFNDGTIQLVLALDLSDDGQMILKSAADSSGQDNFGFKIELNDGTELESPTTYFFHGLVMSFRAGMGALNVIQVSSSIEINSDILYSPQASVILEVLTWDGDALTWDGESLTWEA